VLADEGFDLTPQAAGVTGAGIDCFAMLNNTLQQVQHPLSFSVYGSLLDHCLLLDRASAYEALAALTV
jgi:hypothetical protein